jgi:DNA polymerase
MARQEPFFGGTGALLNRAFDLADVRKSDLYITNVVHCHPPRNRKSLPSEIANCRAYLGEELAIVRPRVIIGLGEDAREVLAAAYPESRQLAWPLLSVTDMAPPTAASPDLLFPTHPGAFRWKPKDLRAELTEQFVDSLARAVRWGFAVEPTCAGMADIPKPLLQ